MERVPLCPRVDPVGGVARAMLDASRLHRRRGPLQQRLMSQPTIHAIKQPSTCDDVSQRKPRRQHLPRRVGRGEAEDETNHQCGDVDQPIHCRNPRGNPCIPRRQTDWERTVVCRTRLMRIGRSKNGQQPSGSAANRAARDLPADEASRQCDIGLAVATYRD